MLSTAVRTAMAVVALVAVQASNAEAQGTTSANGGNISLSAYFDIPTAYLFRGLLQNDTGLIMWPAADARIHLSDTTGPALNVGTWNGVDFYSLGDTPEAFNGGDQTKVVASAGIGFTY